MSEPITIIVDIEYPDLAKLKAKKFFLSKGIRSTDDSFENDKWEGKYRMIGDHKLEITFMRRPWWAKQVVIEPEIQKFFEGV